MALKMAKGRLLPGARGKVHVLQWCTAPYLYGFIFLSASRWWCPVKPKGNAWAAAAPLFSLSSACSLKTYLLKINSSGSKRQIKLCHAASPATASPAQGAAQPHPELARTSPCPNLSSPQTPGCVASTSLGAFIPGMRGAASPSKGQEGALPLPMARAGAGPLLQDAEMLWQSPWQP